jgi:hypothetical protein
MIKTPYIFSQIQRSARNQFTPQNHWCLERYSNPHVGLLQGILSPTHSNSGKPMISINQMISLAFPMSQDVGECWVFLGFVWYGGHNLTQF